MNWQGAGTKLSVCLKCWAFLTFSQKKKHLEHQHHTITPSQLKDEAKFKELAAQYNMMKDEGKTIALFAEKCKLM